MGRIYTVSFTQVAVTAAQDLFEVVAPADSVVLIHDIYVSQKSDTGDAAEEIMTLALKSGQSSSGSGGSSVTPVPKNFGDAAFGGTAEANNTTKASSGTIVTHYVWDWNIRTGFQVIFTPETRPVLSPSRRGTLEMVDAPGDSLTVSGTMTIEEVGG